MIYFIVLLFLIFCIYYFDYAKNQRLYSFSYWGVCIVLILIAGLRYRIGNDSIVYENAYEKFPTFIELFSYNFSSTRFEPGFIIFSSIPRSFSPDFMWSQFWQATVVNIVIFWFVLKNTKNRFFCLTLYFVALFLFFTTEVMRESLAVCCFLLAWPFFRDGKWIKFYILAALACVFHTSAFLLLLVPVFWLPGIRSFFKLGYRALFVGIIVFVLGIYIQMRFEKILTLIAVTERMSEQASIYADSKMYGHGLNIVGMVDVFFRFIFYSLLSLFLYKSHNKKLQLDEHQKKAAAKLEYLVMWLVFIALMGMSMIALLRFTNYFFMFSFVLISTVFMGNIDLKDKVIKLRPLYWSIIMLPFFIFNIYFYCVPVNQSKTLHYYSKYIPYKSRLNPERDKDREAVFRIYGTR